MEGNKPSLGLDLKTPINASLTAFYKRSFAFYTVKERMPIIITQTIDGLTRSRDEIIKKFSLEAATDLKTVIGKLSKLKYEILTNKPLKLVENSEDSDLYNQYLKEQTVKIDQPTAFNTIWLHVECYMYYKIMEAIYETELLKDLDPFQNKKEESFNTTLATMTQLAGHLQKVSSSADIDKEEEFIKLLKISLWGNKCDLSLSAGTMVDAQNMDAIDSLNSNILSDYSHQVWDIASTHESSETIDYVLDNAGFELFTDLCLADFIIKNKIATCVRFYVKTKPWFISDTTTADFNWTLQQLKCNKNPTLKKLGEKWLLYMKNASWKIEEHNFWTLPYTYKDMARIDKALYTKLAEAKLVIFKGDLNYRKLFGERNWAPTTGLDVALQGFLPAPLCSIRTLKADMICGLDDGVAEETEKKEKDWLISGNFGVIQYCDTIVVL